MSTVYVEEWGNIEWKIELSEWHSIEIQIDNQKNSRLRVEFK